MDCPAFVLIAVNGMSEILHECCCAVPVFMIDLPVAGADERRNVRMLKESPWLDIAIAFTNSSRAILAI
jgi:hypothetical protein